MWSFFFFVASIKKVWDYGWLSTFIIYQVLFIVFPTKAMLNENLSIGCSFIILLEQVCKLKNLSL